MATLDDLRRAYYQRYTSSKSAVAGTVASGTTTIITPVAGKRIEIYWVYALTDPDSDVSPLITIALGGNNLYAGYAISHAEVFTGAVGATVTVTLSEPATVAATIHYKEI